MTTTIPILLPLFKAFDNNGMPLAGGLLYSYAAGTTTPQATYPASNETTPNPNPIVLNSRGEALVWLDPTSSYKFNLTDANGNQIPGYPIDNVSGPINLSSNLVPSTTNTYTLGNSLFSWAQLYLGPNYATAYSSISNGIGYWGLTANESAASITPINYFYPPGNVLRYQTNTVPGTTDMSQGIINAFAGALTVTGGSGVGGHRVIYIPAGKYLIGTNNVFNQVPSPYQDGFLVQGEGWDSTQLILNPSSLAMYFFENLNDDTADKAFIIFADMQFAGNEATPLYARWGIVQEDQGFKFWRCWFNNLYFIMLSSSGSASSASEHKFYGCKITGCYGDLFQIANPNSVDWEFYGCDVESNYGSVFNVQSGGGGAIKVYGGSWIMLSLGVSDTYFLVLNGPGLGGNNALFNFNGVKFELHAPASGTGNTKLVHIQTAGYFSKVVFDRCFLNTYPGSGTPRNLVTVYGSCRIEFDHCQCQTGNADTYTINSDQNSLDFLPYGDPGSIIFQDSTVYADHSSLIVFNATTPMGYASARNCYAPGATAITSGGTPSSDTNRYAIDFDLNWISAAGAAQNFPGLKTAMIKPSISNWPDSASTYNYAINLPNNSYIVYILLYRPGGTTGVAYTLQIGNSGNATLYGSVVTADSATAQTFSWDKTATPASWAATGTSAPGNQILISASTTASAAQAGTGGYAIVKYY